MGEGLNRFLYYYELVMVQLIGLKPIQDQNYTLKLNIKEIHIINKFK